VAETFRNQGVNFGEKRAQVAEFPKEEQRAILLARIDQLATAIRAQWVAVNGVKTPRPELPRETTRESLASS
jgi:hypothetical protein